MNEENNTLLQMRVEFRKLVEKIGNLLIGNTSVQEIQNFTEDMSDLLWYFISNYIETKENAEDQQITEI